MRESILLLFSLSLFYKAYHKAASKYSSFSGQLTVVAIAVKMWISFVNDEADQWKRFCAFYQKSSGFSLK